MSDHTNEVLIRLYAEIAELTKPECAQCRVPHGCCNDYYCQQAINWAKKRWGVDLKPANGIGVHGRLLPLMGPDGCIAAPHLRPICAVHTCEIQSLGFKRNDPNWTEKYFSLRKQIEEFEYGEVIDSIGSVQEYLK